MNGAATGDRIRECDETVAIMTTIVKRPRENRP
jgi:hypothetical protein